MEWKPVVDASDSPEKPTGGKTNAAEVDPEKLIERYRTRVAEVKRDQVSILNHLLTEGGMTTEFYSSQLTFWEQELGAELERLSEELRANQINPDQFTNSLEELIQGKSFQAPESEEVGVENVNPVKPPPNSKDGLSREEVPDWSNYRWKDAATPATLTPETPPSSPPSQPEISQGQNAPESTSETPENKLETSREKYARLDYAAKKSKEPLTEDKQKELDEAKAAYFEVLKEEAEGIAKLETGFRGEENLKPDEREAILMKTAAVLRAGEFKRLYDLKTQFRAEEVGETATAKALNAIRKVGQAYNKLSFWKKAALGTALLAGSLAMPTTSILGGVFAAGSLLRRGLAGAGMGVTVEALIKRKQDENLIKKHEAAKTELMDKIQRAIERVEGGNKAAGLAEYLKAQDEDLENNLALTESGLRNKEKMGTATRYLAAGSIGFLIGSGYFGRGIGWVSEKLGDATGWHPFDSFAGAVRESLVGKEIPTGGSAATGAATPEVGAQPETPYTDEVKPDVTYHPPNEALDTLGETSPKPNVEGLFEKTPEPVPYGPLSPEIAPAAPTAIPETPEQLLAESKPVATIKPGGSLWQTGRSLVSSGKISAEQFTKAWSSSTVEIEGVKVPLSEVGLVHEGDQIVFTETPAGPRFEIIDYAKDKFDLGTNQNLYETLQKEGRPAPTWLKESLGLNETPITEATTPDLPPLETGTGTPQTVADIVGPGTSGIEDVPYGPPTPEAADVLPAPLAEEWGNYLEEHNLYDQEEKIEDVLDKLKSNPDQPYLQRLHYFLTHHPLHEQALENYENSWHSTGLAEAEFNRVKGKEVVDIIRRFGSEKFTDYLPTDENLDAEEISHRRSLAELLRKLTPGPVEKGWSVEKFLKFTSGPGGK